MLLSCTHIPFSCAAMDVNKNKTLVICVGCFDTEKHFTGGGGEDITAAGLKIYSGTA